MGLLNFFLSEGASINRSPVFNGDGYSYWKTHVRIFVEAIDLDVWDAIEKGLFVPTNIVDGKSVQKPRNEWTDEHKKKVQHNLKAKNIITSTLGPDEFFSCISPRNVGHSSSYL